MSCFDNVAIPKDVNCLLTFSFAFAADCYCSYKCSIALATTSAGFHLETVFTEVVNFYTHHKLSVKVFINSLFQN